MSFEIIVAIAVTVALHEIIYNGLPRKSFCYDKNYEERSNY